MKVTIKDFDFHTANKGGVFYIDALVISKVDRFFPTGFRGKEIELRLPVPTKHQLEAEFLQLVEFRHTKKEVSIKIVREAFQTLTEKMRDEPKAYVFNYDMPIQLEEKPSHDCPVCGQENVFKSGWNIPSTSIVDDDVITQPDRTGTIYIDENN